MLSVCYAECLLRVVMLIVIMVSVVMVSVAAAVKVPDGLNIP
jgi:hypothetical protein